MSRRNKGSRNGRSGSKPFVMFYKEMLLHTNFIALSPRALKLLLDVASNYVGSNNGDLCVTLKVMKARGWRSNDQLRKALAELEYYEFLTMTRQGGRNHCSLFALGWFAIDHCKGKHDCKETTLPVNGWKKEREAFDWKKLGLGRSAVFGRSLVRTNQPPH